MTPTFPIVYQKCYNDDCCLLHLKQFDCWLLYLCFFFKYFFVIDCFLLELWFPLKSVLFLGGVPISRTDFFLPLVQLFACSALRSLSCSFIEPFVRSFSCSLIQMFVSLAIRSFSCLSLLTSQTSNKYSPIYYALDVRKKLVRS